MRASTIYKKDSHTLSIILCGLSYEIWYRIIECKNFKKFEQVFEGQGH